LRRTVVLFALVLAIVLLVDRRANAQGVGAPTADYGTTPAILTAPFDLPTLIANTYYVARHRRAPVVWPVLGLVFGAGNAALSFAFIIPNASSPSSNGVGWAPFVILGLGVADIAMSIVALALRPSETPAAHARGRPMRWAVIPSAVGDAAGRPAYGMTFVASTF
jgi:hypothetical protein